MEPASWANASKDVKASIITRADSTTARQLCQLDKESREICRDRLPVEKKYEMCLSRAATASRCDSIPIFSQRQFLSLVPKNILVYRDDPVQLTHEFYPQGYKLASEGFALALRKAKIMNTICAVLRPDFLITKDAKEIPIPAYVDSSLVDEVTRQYVAALREAKDMIDTRLSVFVKLYDSTAGYYVVLYAKYNNDFDDGKLHLSEALLNVYSTKQGVAAAIKHALEEDPFVSKDMGVDFVDSLVLHSSSEDGMRYLNAFKVSRYVKALLDLGYLHNPELIVDLRHLRVVQSPF